MQSPFALAPMAGLTDVPLRALAWRYGASYMVSEMVSDKAELWETGKSRLRRVPVPGVTPVAVQIAGTEPKVMADAARRHVDEGVQVIDINFGCPAKKVCRKSAGSALLADLGLLGRIVEAVAGAVPVPVTVKTRTGLTPHDGLGVEAGRVAERAGAAMIVMHARSRACRFRGEVDYSAVAELKASVRVPVLVNGDIGSRAHAEHALTLSRADGAMVGRAVLGQPWIFQVLAGGSVPGRAERWAVILEHVGRMHEFYGDRVGVRVARKHIEAYGRTMGFDARAGLRIDDAGAQCRWLERVRDHSKSIDEKEAA